MSDNDGYFGVQQPEQNDGEYNSITFIVRQILNGRSFAALVKVVNVDPGGTVDVQPMVNQLDGQGKAVPHGVVNDIPYARIQGGKNAIIINPEVGDIGLCVFCDRDISSVKTMRGVANPGSLRRSSMADGVYFGGLLNGEPDQFIRFGPDGITITVQDEPGAITINSQNAKVNGNFSVSGNVSVGNGATGTFASSDGQTVVVQDGIIISIG